MPSPKLLAAVELLAIGAALAAGNLWFTAARSTIPLALDAQVTGKEARPEKHPPNDSVFLLTLDGGYQLHVDAPVHEAIQSGERLEKAAWSRQLRHGPQTLVLDWSSDFRGMRWAMPVVLVIMVITAGCSALVRMPSARHQPGAKPALRMRDVRA